MFTTEWAAGAGPSEEVLQLKVVNNLLSIDFGDWEILIKFI